MNVNTQFEDRAMLLCIAQDTLREESKKEDGYMADSMDTLLSEAEELAHSFGAIRKRLF